MHGLSLHLRKDFLSAARLVSTPSSSMLVEIAILQVSSTLQFYIHRFQ